MSFDIININIDIEIIFTIESNGFHDFIISAEFLDALHD